MDIEKIEKIINIKILRFLLKKKGYRLCIDHDIYTITSKTQSRKFRDIFALISFLEIEHAEELLLTSNWEVKGGYIVNSELFSVDEKESTSKMNYFEIDGTLRKVPAWTETTYEYVTFEGNTLIYKITSFWNKENASKNNFF